MSTAATSGTVGQDTNSRLGVSSRNFVGARGTFSTINTENVTAKTVDVTQTMTVADITASTLTATDLTASETVTAPSVWTSQTSSTTARWGMA